MAQTTKYRTRIKGTGHYLPEEKVTNHDLENFCDTNDAWITERTGIKSRRRRAPGQDTSDLSVEAAKRAMAAADVSIEDIDMILCATVSPDQIMPNTACVIQDKLGAKNIPALDISAACSGFVYGAAIAHQFLVTGTYKNILVVGAEVLTPYVNYQDRNTCILFGDGAGAVVMGHSTGEESSELFSHHLHADGGISDLFVLPAGGSKLPFSHEVLDKGQNWLQMKGKEIFRHAVRTMSQACHEALEANNVPPEKVDWVIPHQANIRIIEAVAKHFGISMEKVIVEIEEMGNTSAATVPVAFDIAIRDGRIQRGDLILLTAFGAGITSGSILLRY
jgi:3-oxoacyl-[acyl-carrier-protein] synthase-3